MFFSVDFELLGEIKPHELKPGGADIQVITLIMMMTTRMMMMMMMMIVFR